MAVHTFRQRNMRFAAARALGHQSFFDATVTVIIDLQKMSWHKDTKTFVFESSDMECSTGGRRSHILLNPKTIRVATGVSADYWEDKTSGSEGYGFWADLEPHLVKCELKVA